MILNKPMPFVYIFRQIRKDLLFILVVGLIINYVSTALSAVIPDMPLSVPTFLGTGISVLLSFKMSQSYDRWWEARKVWGAIVNDSRSFVLQLQNFISNQEHPSIRKIAYRQIAWCYSLGQSLRGLSPVANLEQFLDPADMEAISNHNNKPLALLQLNSAELRMLKDEGQMELFSHMRLDETLVRLCDSMGKAERINSTVFPVTYRMFLHYAIYLFVIVLSIALRNVQPEYEIPLLLFISSVFFLLEKTAYYLQDPFRNRPSDVSVSAISRTIEINIKQLLGEKEIPEPVAPEKFYIM